MLASLPQWLVTALAALGALYAILSILATFATQFWPSSSAAHYLAAAVLDVAKIRAMVAGFLPGTVAKVAVTTLVVMCSVMLAGCAWFTANIDPILQHDEQAFVACVEAKLPTELADLLALNAAGEVQIAADCLGVALSSQQAQANAPAVHAMASARSGAVAMRAKATSSSK